MRQLLLANLFLLGACLALGCGEEESETASNAGETPGFASGKAGQAGASASPKDAGLWGTDSGKTASDSGKTTELCGNGLDDDGDGNVDEDCACKSGETQPCFLGAVKLAGVGVCVRGTQTCVASSSQGEFHKDTWGPCLGFGKPSVEQCNGKDDDCNGTVDEGCSCLAGATKQCSSACGQGTQTCDKGVWTDCTAPLPKTEICGDGVDQDCDGADDPCPGSCSDGVQNQDETSVDCGGICGERTLDRTYEMNHETTDSAGLQGTERIVSVDNTGGSWCAWESSSSCPLSCPAADIVSGGQAVHIGGDTKWEDNSGSCSYRLHICGKP